MKLNNFAKLFIILFNVLCALSSPTIDTTTVDLNRRGLFKCLKKGNVLKILQCIAAEDAEECLKKGGAKIGRWTCCSMNCMSEPIKECQNACLSEKGKIPNGCIPC